MFVVGVGCGELVGSAVCMCGVGWEGVLLSVTFRVAALAFWIHRYSFLCFFAGRVRDAELSCSCGHEASSAYIRV